MPGPVRPPLCFTRAGGLGGNAEQGYPIAQSWSRPRFLLTANRSKPRALGFEAGCVMSATRRGERWASPLTPSAPPPGRVSARTRPYFRVAAPLTAGGHSAHPKADDGSLR
jgi:hypothetical protein